jgi:hypothetical protein
MLSLGLEFGMLIKPGSLQRTLIPAQVTISCARGTRLEGVECVSKEAKRISKTLFRWGYD